MNEHTHTLGGDVPLFSQQEFQDVVCDSSALQSNMTLEALETHSFENYDERQVEIKVTELVSMRGEHRGRGN